MTSWQDFKDAAPELAERAEAAFTATTNAVLATTRKDGSPRVSGIDPMFYEGELWLGSMPDARKADDLLRDPRMALHCVPWESRQAADGEQDPAAAGDAKLTGRAVDVTDRATIDRVVGARFEELDQEAPQAGNLFRIDIERVTTVRVEDEKHLVVEWWSPEGGVQRVQRD
jgi:hypothetical protein